MKSDATPLMNGKQLAEYLGLNYATIRTWTSMRKIPYYKIGYCVRFRKSEIDEWLAAQKQEPQDREW